MYFTVASGDDGTSSSSPITCLSRCTWLEKASSWVWHSVCQVSSPTLSEVSYCASTILHSQSQSYHCCGSLILSVRNYKIYSKHLDFDIIICIIIASSCCNMEITFPQNVLVDEVCQNQKIKVKIEK